MLNKTSNYDLYAALEENPQDSGITFQEITEILANIEGQNDGNNWIWIVALDNGKFAYLEGGCDYTGWDCQSSLDSTILNTPTDGIELVERDEKDLELDIQTSLAIQLSKGKNVTWRESAGKDLGLI